MIAPAGTFAVAPRAVALDHPLYQWERPDGDAAVTLRLFGALGARELDLVADALAARSGSPRESAALDFEQVEHVDYRAIPGFVRSVTRLRDRGSTIWLVGLSPYVRRLFDAAGQGVLLRQLAWEDRF